MLRYFDAKTSTLVAVGLTTAAVIGGVVWAVYFKEPTSPEEDNNDYIDDRYADMAAEMTDSHKTAKQRLKAYDVLHGEIHEYILLNVKEQVQQTKAKAYNDSRYEALKANWAEVDAQPAAAT